MSLVLGLAFMLAFALALRDSWRRRWHDVLRPRQPQPEIVIEIHKHTPA